MISAQAPAPAELRAAAWASRAPASLAYAAFCALPLFWDIRGCPVGLEHFLESGGLSPLMACIILGLCADRDPLCGVFRRGPCVALGAVAYHAMYNPINY